MPDALGVMWHHQTVLRAFLTTGAKAEKWDECDPSLKAFAHMAWPASRRRRS